MSDKWIVNENGNHIWVASNGPRATVYPTPDHTWAAVWNGALDGRPRRLKEKFAYPEDAEDAVEVADNEGQESDKWWPPDAEWIANKNGGYRRKVNGVVVSVKQAKSGSWYATRMGGMMLGQNGQTTWFRTAGEACGAVNAYEARQGSWRWIGQNH